jgi:hypothetical protein
MMEIPEAVPMSKGIASKTQNGQMYLKTPNHQSVDPAYIGPF